MDIKQISVAALPENFKEVYNTLKEETSNFTDEDAMVVYEDEISEFLAAVKKKLPAAIKKEEPKEHKPKHKKESPSEIDKIMEEEGVSREKAENILKARMTAKEKAAKSDLKELIEELKQNPLYKGKLSDKGIDPRTYKPTSKEKRDRDLAKDRDRSAITVIKRKSPTYGQAGGAKKPYYYEYRENRLDVDRRVQLAKGGEINLIKAEHKKFMIDLGDYFEAVKTAFQRDGSLRDSIETIASKFWNKYKLGPNKSFQAVSTKELEQVLDKLKSSVKTYEVKGYWDIHAFNNGIYAPENSRIAIAWNKLVDTYNKLTGYTIGYELGDTYHKFFDYKGMFQYAKSITSETSTEDLKKLSDSFSDVNYHEQARITGEIITAKKAKNEKLVKQKVTALKASVMKELGENTTFSSKHEYITRRQIDFVKIKFKGKTRSIPSDQLADGMYMKMKEGGKLKDGYTYVPNRDIEGVVLVDGRNLSGDMFSDGLYIKNEALKVSKDEYEEKKHIAEFYDLKKYEPLNLSKIQEGKKFLLPNGEVIEIVELYTKTQSGEKVNFVNYSRNEVSHVNEVKTLLQFFKNWKAIPYEPKKKHAPAPQKELKIKRGQVRKGVHGWSATTMVYDVEGYDWKITTMKRSSGQLTTSAQAGKESDAGSGFNAFKFTMFQDPTIGLIKETPSRVTDKVVADQHNRGVDMFLEQKGLDSNKKDTPDDTTSKDLVNEKRKKLIRKKGTILTFKEEQRMNNGETFTQIMVNKLEKKSGSVRVDGMYGRYTKWFKDEQELIDNLDWRFHDKKERGGLLKEGTRIEKEIFNSDYYKDGGELNNKTVADIVSEISDYMDNYGESTFDYNAPRNIQISVMNGASATQIRGHLKKYGQTSLTEDEIDGESVYFVELDIDDKYPVRKMKDGGETCSTCPSSKKKAQTCEVVKDGERSIDPADIKKMTECIVNLPQTKTMHTDKDGNYTPERKRLHVEIINEFKKGVVCIERDQPIAILMGGSPASGKSTFLKKYRPFLLKNEIYKVDADEVRAKLPEYEGWNASQTHLETKDIVNTLISDRTIGVPCRFDLIYDGTMNNTKSYVPLIDLLHKDGYKVFIVYIDKVSEKTIKQRALERYKKSGRFVPMEVIDDFFQKGTSALEELKSKVDGYIIVDGSNQDYDIIEKGGMSLPEDRKYSELGKQKLKRGGRISKSAKFKKVMSEFKAGTLTSNGRKVTDKDQAIAIAFSESGLSKMKK